MARRSQTLSTEVDLYVLSGRPHLHNVDHVIDTCLWILSGSQWSLNVKRKGDTNSARYRFQIRLGTRISDERKVHVHAYSLTRYDSSHYEGTKASRNKVPEYSSFRIFSAHPIYQLTCSC